MSFIHDFLHVYGVDLVGKLVKSGFSNGQAQLFLIETPGEVLTALCNWEQKCSCGRRMDDHAISQFMASLDIGGLAAKADIAPQLASRGLRTMLPALLHYFHESQSGWQSDVAFPTVH